jgi:deoxycytidine triphosphate deaminase
VSILSDATLREKVSNGKLVLNGDPARARHCSYEHKPGRIVFGGIREENKLYSVNLAAPGVTSATIPPSGVAWVRTQEQVSIPHDMVGFWLQTNSLSRRGLLLLNSTLVEPGYTGYLAAHIVNLGAQPVTITRDDTIAKLVFMTLDRAAFETVNSGQYADYDGFIDRLAASANASFLSISELIPRLHDEVRRELNEGTQAASRRIDDLISGAMNNFEKSVQERRQRAEEGLSDFGSSFLKKSLGGFLFGLVCAVAVFLWVLPRLRASDQESKSRIETIVKDLGRELRVETSLQNKAISDEIKRLREEVSAIDIIKPRQQNSWVIGGSGRPPRL